MAEAVANQGAYPSSMIPTAIPVQEQPVTQQEESDKNKKSFTTTLKQVGTGPVKVYGSIFVTVSTAI